MCPGREEVWKKFLAFPKESLIKGKSFYKARMEPAATRPSDRRTDDPPGSCLCRTRDSLMRFYNFVVVGGRTDGSLVATPPLFRQ